MYSLLLPDVNVTVTVTVFVCILQIGFRSSTVDEDGTRFLFVIFRIAKSHLGHLLLHFVFHLRLLIVSVCIVSISFLLNTFEFERFSLNAMSVCANGGGDGEGGSEGEGCCLPYRK